MGRNTAWVAASGSRLAIAYQETQTLALYEIKDGRFRQAASLGDEPAPERESFDPDPSHSRVSYVALFADSDRVYAVNAHTDVAALVRGVRTGMWWSRCTIGQGAGWVRIVSTGKTSGW